MTQKKQAIDWSNLSYFYVNSFIFPCYVTHSTELIFRLPVCSTCGRYKYFPFFLSPATCHWEIGVTKSLIPLFYRLTSDKYFWHRKTPLENVNTICTVLYTASKTSHTLKRKWISSDQTRLLTLRTSRETDFRFCDISFHPSYSSQLHRSLWGFFSNSIPLAQKPIVQK